MLAVLTRSVLISCAALVTPVYGCSAVPKAGEPVVNPAVRGDNAEATRASSAFYFKPDIVDLGDQLWKEHVPFTLTLCNGGAKSVSVLHVRTSCGCTVLDQCDFPTQGIGPGESHQLRGFLATERTAGRQQHKVVATLDSGLACEVKLRVNVRATYTLTSHLLSFPDVTDLDRPGMLVVGFSSDSVTLAGEPTTDADWLDLRVQPRAGNDADVLARLRRECVPTGYSVATIVIPTSCRRVPLTPVLVQAYHPSSLVPVPLHLELPSSGQLTVRLLSYRGGASVIVPATCATSSDPRVVVEVDERGDVLMTRDDEQGEPFMTYVSIRSLEGQRTMVLVSSGD